MLLPLFGSYLEIKIQRESKSKAKVNEYGHEGCKRGGEHRCEVCAAEPSSDGALCKGKSMGALEQERNVEREVARVNGPDAFEFIDQFFSKEYRINSGAASDEKGETANEIGCHFSLQG
ncbi:hypothetical protein [Bryocella elongata]|uniref:hypothetical protein n=1 Tax=Bryocella elongata TaxID=863522 RepID=UPI0011B0840F|nr:hypothetical protein [Bryocella elongata]